MRALRRWMNSDSSVRLLAELVTLATAIVSLVAALMLLGSRDAAVDRADELASQLDSLQSQVDEVRGPGAEDSEDDTESDGEPADTATGALDLDAAVGTEGCGGEFGRWSSAAAQLSGETFNDAFGCIPQITMVSDQPVGHVDFLVPDGAARLTGTVGIDDRSSNDELVAQVHIETVPASGAALFSQDLEFGQSADFEVAVDGRLRIRMVAEVVVAAHPDWESSATIAWANVRFE